MIKDIIGTKVIVGVLIFLALTIPRRHLRSRFPIPCFTLTPSKRTRLRRILSGENAGTAGGEVEKGGVTPVLEEGLIEIKQLRFKHEGKWYTPKRISFGIHKWRAPRKNAGC